MINPKQRAIQLLKASRKEITFFQRTENAIALSQGCEKVWVAFRFYLIWKTNGRIRSHDDISKFAQITRDEDFYRRAAELHNFHYNQYADNLHEFARMAEDDNYTLMAKLGGTI